MLVVVDLGLLAMSLLAALMLWSNWDPARFAGAPWASEPEWFLLPLLWVGAGTVTGCYDLRLAAEVTKVLRAQVLNGMLVLALYAIAYFLAPRDSLPRSVILVHVVLTMAALGLWRAGYAHFFRRPAFLRRALVVGAGKAGESMVGLIQSEGRSLYTVVGVVDDDPTNQGRTLAGVPVLGRASQLTEIALEAGVSEAVVAITRTLSPEVLEELLKLPESGVEVTPMTLLYEALTGRVPVDHVGDNWYIALPLAHPQTMIGYSFFKRVFDVSASSLGLLLFGLLLPLLAILIKLDSAGPVFYGQTRLGKNGRPFRLLKLRTMDNDAEADGKAIWASPSDVRVTRVGRVLRASSLDEMPQLWNVIRGEMSMVGPRPERPELVERLDQEIPYYRLRHAVNPGLTGWALLNLGYAGSMEDALAKVQYDLYYIKHQSLWLDLQIILRSIGRGATLRRSETRSRNPGIARD